MIIPELVYGCQLRCALCWNRARVPSNNQMSIKVVKKVLEKFRRYRIDWFNWGEPLLHTEFIAISELIRGTKSCISSNFSLPLMDDQLDALNNFNVACISLSGMTPDVYKIYHKGGNHDLVMDNLRRFIARSTTKIHIRWLMHKYNEHQLNDCRKFCEENDLFLEPVILNAEVENLLDESFQSELYVPRKRQKRTFCHIIKWIPIGYDGRYYLCCASHNVDTGYTIFDDITLQELIDIKRKIPLCTQCQAHEIWRSF